MSEKTTPVTPWLILDPGEEGNHGCAYLVVNRASYVKYLAGKTGGFSHERFVLRTQAEANCNLRNRGRYG